MSALIMIALALLLCMALYFFFSGSETAIISVNKYRLRSMHEQGDASAGKLLELLANTQRLLVMVLICSNLMNVLVALTFDLLVEHGWPHLASQTAFWKIRWSDLLGLAVLTPIVIIFAEILPKTLFRSRADRIIESIRPVLLTFLWLLRPIIIIVEHLTNLVLSPLSEQRTRAMRQLTRQDVINLISPEEEVEEEKTESSSAEPAASQTIGGVIARETASEEERLAETTDERRMIHRIIQLQETRAYEIMTPLVDLITVQLGQLDVEGFKRLADQTGYSRFPVYRDRLVNLIGYIDVYRVLREGNGVRPLEQYVERGHFVPESKRVDDLLQDFLRLRLKAAIIVNEYGGCTGWISREDILEEIVGELEDELDEPSRAVVEAPDGSFLIEGRTEIDHLNDLLGADFSDEDWETLSGLILSEMGRIPQVGDEITINGWRATIVMMTGHRIDQVRLTPLGK